MGILLSKAVEGIGSLLGSTVFAPLKKILAQSCEGVCADEWDIFCFIEHLCIASLANLFMVVVLSYITILFFYVLLRLGVVQCVMRSVSRMTIKGCYAYCYAMRGMYWHLRHTVKNTRRVHRGRRRMLDLEEGCSSCSERGDTSFDSHSWRHDRRRRRRRRMDGRSYSWNTGFSSRHGRSSGHGVRLRTREVIAQVKGSTTWKAKQNRTSVRRDAYNNKLTVVMKRKRGAF